MEYGNSRNYAIIVVIFAVIATAVLTLHLRVLYDNRLLKSEVENEEFFKVNTSEIEAKLEDYTNIDNTIKEAKEEYFNNIRKLEDKILAGESDKKIAYLTFDDGPYQLTYQVLDILKENNVPATFFVLGKDAEDRYKRIVNEGHTLANHTMYHNIGKGLYKSTDSFMSQVNQLEDYLYNITGYRTSLVRFPGGSGTASAYTLKDSIEEQLHNKGYKYVDWTCETGDGSDKRLQQKSEWQWYKDTCKDQKIMVLLMHDYHQGTVKILPDIIKDLKDQGYLILPLSNKSVMSK